MNEDEDYFAILLIEKLRYRMVCIVCHHFYKRGRTKYMYI